MVHSMYVQLGIVLETMIGQEHPYTHSFATLIWVLMDQEMDLEEYSTWDHNLKPHLPNLIKFWLQICLS